jgi:hypothetical protein
MSESITVNGVVFTVLEGNSSIWRNGYVYIEHLSELGWRAVSWSKLGHWCDTPESALLDLAKQATSWAPVLLELARVNGSAA